MAKFAVAGNAEFLVTDPAGTVRNMTSHIDDLGTPPTKSVMPLDVTTFGDAAETFIAGIQASKEISISGPYDNTASTGPDAVFALLVGTAVAYTLYPVGTASGSRKYTGSLLFTNYEPGGGVKERVSYITTASMTGTVTVGTV
jgi:hypothetical protein